MTDPERLTFEEMVAGINVLPLKDHYWGIYPHYSKKALINAPSERVRARRRKLNYYWRRSEGKDLREESSHDLGWNMTFVCSDRSRFYLTCSKIPRGFYLSFPRTKTDTFEISDSYISERLRMFKPGTDTGLITYSGLSDGIWDWGSSPDLGGCQFPFPDITNTSLGRAKIDTKLAKGIFCQIRPHHDESGPPNNDDFQLAKVVRDRLFLLVHELAYPRGEVIEIDTDTDVDVFPNELPIFGYEQVQLVAGEAGKRLGNANEVVYARKGSEEIFLISADDLHPWITFRRFLLKENKTAEDFLKFLHQKVLYF
jgi:hypothetical protein